MFKRLCREFFLGVALLFMLCLGFATPALAEGEPTYVPSDAKLTAVIVAPIGTDASKDKYVFHFDGDGTVTGKTDNNGNLHVYSDEIEQVVTTVKVGDVVPKIGDEYGNVTLNGIKLTDANSLTNGQLGQTVVQKSLSEILSADKFPHAGVYTYEVTQTSATSDSGTAYIAASNAKYCLRIWVKNAKTEGSSELGDTSLVIDYVTVHRLNNDDGADETKNDDGRDKTVKVDPTYPTTDANGRIDSILATQQVEAGKLAGDARGRNVPGFTFANEYYTVGPFQVKKLYDGDHSDRTRYSTVELAVKASVSPNASGGYLTYKIEGEGKDLTEGRTANGEQGSKVSFGDNGWCYIKAELKEGSSIRITGEFDSSGNVLSPNGLFRGQAYYVLENDLGDYRPTGYVYVGTDAVDPRTNYSDNNNLWYSQSDVGNSPINGYTLPDGTTKEINAFALLIENRNTTGNDTIFVVNKLDEQKVSATGIFFDNLPYILMIGVPLVVFAGMFVARRRGNAA